MYYKVIDWINDVYVTSLDPETGKLGSPDKIVSHVGPKTSVEWSPDGEALVYARGVGMDELYSLALGIRSLATGEGAFVPPRAEPVRWTRFRSRTGHRTDAPFSPWAGPRIAKAFSGSTRAPDTSRRFWQARRPESNGPHGPGMDD